MNVFTSAANPSTAPGWFRATPSSRPPIVPTIPARPSNLDTLSIRNVSVLYTLDTAAPAGVSRFPISITIFGTIVLTTNALPAVIT